MTTSFRHFLRAFSVSTLLLVCACDNGSDERTKQITPGMRRADALAALQGGSAAPGQAAGNTRIWRIASYLVDGKTIEVIWYSGSDEHRTAADTVPTGKVYPVVLEEGIVVGAGRAVLDSVAEKRNLPRDKY